jgi:heterodisulfide reductase subunit B
MGAKMELSYYPGCTAHSTAIEYEDSIVAVLKEFGISVKEIEDWNCCGSGPGKNISEELVVNLSARNIKMAEKSDKDLIVPCAGCFASLKKAEFALKNDKYRPKIEETVDFKFKGNIKIEYILETFLKLGLDNFKSKVKKDLSGLKAVCYYGCAIVRPSEVVEFDNCEHPVSMDNLMKAVGVDVLDWPSKVDCCGGDAALTNPKLASKLINRIVDYAKEAGANCIITSCGLCQANIDTKQDMKNPLPILYFTEVLGHAMGAGDSSKWWKKHIVDPSKLFK